LTLLTPEVNRYLQQFLTPLDETSARLEQVAKEQMIPIMDPDTARLLRVWAVSNQPKSILEVGTAIGYSAYLMATSTRAQITTIEIDAVRYEQAVKLFTQTGLSNRITAVHSDALTFLPSLQGQTFDWIFLDASKGQYPRFLELLLPLMAPQSLLFSDNILFQGLVSGPEEVKHKLRTIVTRLRSYNQLLAEHPLLETAFLPLGDGLAVSTLRPKV
jgi:predicted O-methyltransferase YrrM